MKTFDLKRLPGEGAKPGSDSLTDRILRADDVSPMVRFVLTGARQRREHAYRQVRQLQQAMGLLHPHRVPKR